MMNVKRFAVAMLTTAKRCFARGTIAQYHEVNQMLFDAYGVGVKVARRSLSKLIGRLFLKRSAQPGFDPLQHGPPLRYFEVGCTSRMPTVQVHDCVYQPPVFQPYVSAAEPSSQPAWSGERPIALESTHAFTQPFLRPTPTPMLPRIQGAGNQMGKPEVAGTPKTASGNGAEGEYYRAKTIRPLLA